MSRTWKPYNTYDYVSIDDWTVGEDIELFAVAWDAAPRSQAGFDRDWTIQLDLQARSRQHPAQTHPLCLIVQITSVEHNAFRIRFHPGHRQRSQFEDKHYGPIVSERLTAIKDWESQRGLRPHLVWNPHGCRITLNDIALQLTHTPQGQLTIHIERLRDGARTDISSGPLMHAAPDVGTVANMSRQTHHASHYFGLGEIAHYNLSRDVDAEDQTVGVPGTFGYGVNGRSSLDHSGHTVTCYNYDNLWYNQPEVVPDSVGYRNAFKSSSGVPLYLNAPFYIERSTPNGQQQFLGVLLDNPGQTFFAFDQPQQSAGQVRAGAQRGEFDSHYFYADRCQGILNAYTHLMGRGPLSVDNPQASTLNARAVMPPKYVFGYFQAKYGFLGLMRPANAPGEHHDYIEDMVEGHRKANVPLEGLGIDIDIQEDKKTFTIKDSFWSEGQVGKGLSAFDWAAQFRLKCQTNITPFIRADRVALDPDDKHRKPYETAQGLIQKGYCVANVGEGNIERFRGPRSEHDYPALSFSPYKGERYPDQHILVLDYGFNARSGERDMIGAVVTDYGNPDAARFWGDQYKYLLRNGLSFVWQDMTVPDSMPHVEDGKNYADTEATRDQYGWSTTGAAAQDDRRKTDTFNWRSFHGQLHLTDPRYGDRRTAPFAALRNFHAYMLARSTYEYGLEAHADLLKPYKRSYIICRSGYPGLQHYAGHWIGDNASSWFHLQVSLPQILNLGLSGIPIAGVDVGGFAPGEAPDDPRRVIFDADNLQNHNPMVYDRLAFGPNDRDIGAVSEPELITRWIQTASMMPWVRNHYDAMKAYQEVYRYTQPATPDGTLTFGDIMAAFIRFRVRWHHVLYNAMYHNTQDGTPIVQAMCLWDDDEAVFADQHRDLLATQYFISRSVLIAPIINKSRHGIQQRYKAGKDVYLPRHDRDQKQALVWYRYHPRKDQLDAQALAGGQRHSITADIGDMPVFVRAGAILPERHFVSTVDAPFRNIQAADELDQPLVLACYPPQHDAAGHYTLYWDDAGFTRQAEQEGVYSLIDVRQQQHHGDWRLALTATRYRHPLPTSLFIRRRGCTTATTLRLNDQLITDRLDNQDALFQYERAGYWIDTHSDSVWITVPTRSLKAGQTLHLSMH